jgi:superfamily II DNA or RNA helicase
LRSGLGLCKHLLVIIDDVFRTARRLARAVRESRSLADPSARVPRLVWNPEIPLKGEIDRLSGLRLQMPGRRAEPAHPGHGLSASAARSMAGRSTVNSPAAGPSVDPPLAAGPSAGLMARVRSAFAADGIDPSVRVDPERRYELLLLLRAVLGSRSRAALDASPSARALVLEELERADRRLRNAHTAPKAIGQIHSLKRRLYPYQREGVERFLFAGRLLLADDMGLGKTTEAIAACHALFESGLVAKGLVIAPASLKAQWLREWQDTTFVPAAVVDGAAEDRARQYRELRSGFLIINYEQLLRDAGAIHALRPEMVVVDEAQRIKNYATKSAVFVKALDPEYRLVLTGTPMENRLEELASILDWIDDVALAPKWRLVPWHTILQGDGSAGGQAGARNLDTMRLRLRSCLLRRVRREVLDQLPARTDTRVPVEITSQQASEHDELTAPIARLVKIGQRRPLLQPEFLKLMQLLMRQRIIANGLGQLRFEEIWPAYSRARPDDALLDGLFAPKLTELRRLVADLVITQGRKVVIFSQWRRMLRLAEWSLRDVLGDAGLRAVFFTGAEKQSQRARSVVDFHDDPRACVMLLSDAGGVGLNLQKAANACINLELPWNPAVLEQRVGRIHRIGQKRPIDVYNLVTESSIEARIAGLIGVKQALFSGLFDGAKDEIRFDAAASFLTRVERMIDPAALGAEPATGIGTSTACEGEDAEDAQDAQDAEDREEGPASAEVTLDEGTPVDDVSPAISAAEPDTESGVAVVDAAAAVAVVDTAAVGVVDAADVAVVDTGAPVGPVTRDSIAALFETLRVEPTRDGGIRIEAPARAAGLLAALFHGMGKLVESAVRREDT